MKIKINNIYKSLILIFLPFTILLSQEGTNHSNFNLSGGIGVHLFNSPSLTDYLNSLSLHRYDDFIVNPEFSVSFGRQISKNYSLNLDYTYIINSFNIENVTTKIENQLNIHIPIIILYHYYRTNGVILKLGLGAGYSYAVFSRKIFVMQTEKFFSRGFGLKLAIEANTPFGDNIYGLIAGDVKFMLMSELRNSVSEKLTFRYGNQNKSLDLDFFNIGLKFGIIYYF
ncbi:MAG: hypothetical protein IGBAC_0724 [Ignavibacteriae bacterium]|nr:MAG: hypothetical protein IGBAC_0724 [Ignavibacteriota bacterium]